MRAAVDGGCTVSDTLRVDCAPVVHVRRTTEAVLSVCVSTAHERTTVTLTVICALLEPAEATLAPATAARVSTASAFVIRLDPDNDL